MEWIELKSIQQFEALFENEPLFAVFKDSTRCSISRTAKSRVEREWKHNFPIYYLDLLNHRDVSSFIAEKTGVEHQSPQLIVIQNKTVIYDASHNFIFVDTIKTA